MTRAELLESCMDMGENLLVNGAEINRVEEAVERILCSYCVEGGSAFAIPSLLIVTLPDEEGRPMTHTIRVHERQTDLNKVDRLNDLCRRICQNRPERERIVDELREIEAAPVYSSPVRILAFALIGGSFALLFGGSMGDGVCALICGMAIGCICRLVSGRMNLFFLDVLASAVSALIALSSARLFPGLQSDKIIMGAFMNLVPGVAITTFIRDLIAGDLVAGAARLLEALLIACAVAIGTGLVMSAFHLAGGLF